ncbi:MAG TPA: phage tail tube protein, partial [Anaerolineales bacterium]|nr:phage tail tube protein [Anaerolineales bacterium]
DGVVAYVKSFDFTLDNLLNADGYMLDGSNVRGSLDKQGINLTGTMTLEYIAASYAQRTAYLDNATKWLTLIFTSTETIEPGYFYTMTVDIKYVKYTEAGDDIGGRDAIPLTIGWTAKAPAAGQEFIKVTLRDALAAKWSA